MLLTLDYRCRQQDGLGCPEDGSKSGLPSAAALKMLLL